MILLKYDIIKIKLIKFISHKIERKLSHLKGKGEVFPATR